MGLGYAAKEIASEIVTGYYERRAAENAKRTQQACKDIQRVLAQGVERQADITGSYEAVDLQHVIDTGVLGRSLETRDCDFRLVGLGGVVCVSEACPIMKLEQSELDATSGQPGVEVL